MAKAGRAESKTRDRWPAGRNTSKSSPCREPDHSCFPAQDIKHLGVMEQCQEILRKTKANPINNSSWRVMSARKRGRKALMTAEGALEREWDIGEKIQVPCIFPNNLVTGG